MDFKNKPPLKRLSPVGMFAGAAFVFASLTRMSTSSKDVSLMRHF